MTTEEKRGQNWSDQEVDLVVADYFAMLNAELRGESVNKSRRNADLQRLIGRTHGSIEYKHQNISAVLSRLGEPTITGYKPMFNFQGALVAGVERFLDRGNGVEAPMQVPEFQLAESPQLFIEPAPLYAPDPAEKVIELSRLLQKYDPAERDQRNRTLGRNGEEFALQAERSRLYRTGRPDLAKEVRWVADEDGDGAGFDILSFSNEGSERYLEVKTTRGPRLTPFYLSRNEKKLSDLESDRFRIFRLYDFGRVPRAFLIEPPLDRHVHLETEVYRASFG